MSRQLRAFLLVLTALLAALVVVPAATAEPKVPQKDAFYQPPKAKFLRDKAPGTVLRSRRVDISSNGFGQLLEPVNSWQILYRSTSARGLANAVSGTVIVPKAPWTDGPRPLVSYAVGTHGMGPECAPSYHLAKGEEDELNLLNLALRRGWAVVVTDYEGLGTPGPHTYEAGPSQAHAVLDAARAAHRLRAAHLKRGPVGLWGYSEGGFAVGWAAEQAASYAPKMKVVGSAVGASPADLEEVARLHDGGPASGLVLAAAVGLARAYPSAPFEEILTREGKRMAKDIGTLCTTDMVAKYPMRKLANYTTVADPIAMPAWQRVLDTVELGTRAPRAPIMLYHSPADELILFDQGLKLRSQWCSAGVDVQFTPVAGDHIGGAITGAPLVVSYLADRFAGEPARSTCAVSPWP